MTDVQRVVDDLRSFCQSNDQVLTGGERGSAEAYRDACLAVNQRLRRCEDFLQKGLRSEALQLAEAEPPLLDALAELDFPERAQWDEVAAAYGLPPAPKLNVATAEALNRAYAEEEPLRDLLREHRRLNLVRAPLTDRLAVLRRLRQLDPGNPVWPADLRAFESARFRELQVIVEEATTGDDYARMAACSDELQITPWLAPPPPALTNRLTGAFLQRIADDLYHAYKRQDFDQGFALRDRWTRLTPAAVFPPDDPVWDRVNLSLDWLRREDARQARRLEYENALTHLEQALSTEQSTDFLRFLWSRLADFNRPIPPALGERYSARVESLRRQAQQREWVILAASFSAGAVALVGFLLFVMLRSH